MNWSNASVSSYDLSGGMNIEYGSDVETCTGTACHGDPGVPEQLIWGSDGGVYWDAEVGDTSASFQPFGLDSYKTDFYVQLNWSCPVLEYGDNPRCPRYLSSTFYSIHSEPFLVSVSGDGPEPEPKVGSLTIADAAMFEGEAGGLDRVMQFRVSLKWPSDATAADKAQTVTVRYSTSDGHPDYPGHPDAHSGEDYLAVANGLLTFQPGYKSLLAPVTLVGDRNDEGEPIETKMEDLSVTLSQPENATIAKDRAAGKIYDNDGPQVFGPTGGPTIAAIAGGNVTISVGGGTPQAAGPGTTVDPGSVLRNVGTTPATVNFPDGTSIVLAPGATLGWKDDPTLFNQPRGTVWYSLVPQLSLAWGVATRFSTLAIRGTTFVVDESGDGDRLQVYEGAVDATGDGNKTVSVTANKQTVCTSDSPCTSPSSFTAPENPFWGSVETTSGSVRASVTDPKDTKGPWDLKKVVVTVSDSEVTATLTMYDPWKSSLLRGTQHTLYVAFDTGLNYDCLAYIFYPFGGETLGGNVRDCGKSLFNVKSKRTDSRSVKMTFDRTLLLGCCRTEISPDDIRWRAQAVIYPGPCSPGYCTDNAPKKGKYVSF